MKRTPARPSAAPANGSVRIVGGRWRGTRLPVVESAGLRPTSDRARETLFNWLQPMLPGARVLDLFAGTGALGLEAVSRGAREALLVERAPALAESLRTTIERLDARDAVSVMRADALAFLRAPLFGRFDLVFLDPPFADALWQPALDALSPWVNDDAWLYVETPVDQRIEPGPGWRLHREDSTRDARHALHRRSPDGAATAAATLARPPEDDANSLP